MGIAPFKAVLNSTRGALNRKNAHEKKELLPHHTPFQAAAMLGKIQAYIESIPRKDAICRKQPKKSENQTNPNPN